MLKPLIIIPSRLGSTRLPEKALKIINGQPMIRHVWSNALHADLGPVIVATDSERIIRIINFNICLINNIDNHNDTWKLIIIEFFCS